MQGESERPYGKGDASFQAAGGEAGLRALVDGFFDRMGSDPRFAPIYAMHPDDEATSRDKLARFLCGWLGGPKLYHEKYGSIGIPRVHAHLAIATDERDQWLTCMAETVDWMNQHVKKARSPREASAGDDQGSGGARRQR